MRPYAAHHEAGHAVAAWLLDIPIELVRVRGCGPHERTTKLCTTNKCSRRTDARLAIAALAGIAAIEAIYGSGSSRLHGDDLRKALRHGRAAAGGDRRVAKAYVRANLRELCTLYAAERYQAAFRELACRLLRDSEMSGQAVCGLLHRCLAESVADGSTVAPDGSMLRDGTSDA